NIIGGCLNGLCTNGGVANLSNKNTYLTSGGGGLGLVTSSWNFDDVWDIGLAMPYLQVRENLPLVISGTSTAFNTNIHLVVNGVIIDKAISDLFGSFSFVKTYGSISLGSNLLIYLDSGLVVGNVVARFQGANINDISVVSNTLRSVNDSTASAL